MKKNTKTIRIISGKWKGKKIIIPNIKTLKPTKDIIKETLFNWIEPYIYKSSCLDCFAGSGSLGLEALSRNASSVIFLEKDINIIKILKKNIKKLKILNTKIINTNAIKWIKKNEKKYNLIFIDPPFQTNLITEITHKIEINKCLKNESLIYIEQNNKNKNITLPKNWIIYKTNHSKNITYSIYKVK
ncbi:16S rRNA (guanine(966)-N(2))-methyltransferase RsmD [Candidatus Purcelliella pentastirinorum]|uniref:Ribosomal RNA small subunit methyltransferase D n=1 Tax=Candidatus Purcelliella pentastirinorum TaxID=472834 RepID=A0AAX3NAH8_9ENTR|nr:16S rRNA (guanine(966)-N(2))-methyltransferase RsmD [Candidatus Purcelliella pentastirinorum]WDI78470.1 16S rRNA (guanine(966)-N(2))-methyltransferase RsmD [Candidatus Purcelliella pentastirinorum]WDR80501.1 16S rRNA (guanine(966)-N(2))-methyltransferase RsmD [Candidatus Purcelliella pentastirinorum]